MLTRKEALEKYGSDYQIKKRVADGTLRKITKGLYSEGESIPALAVISIRYPNAILTMGSAFYLYGLTDVIPDEYDLATGRDAPKISDKNIRQYFVPDYFLTVGGYRNRKRRIHHSDI